MGKNNRLDKDIVLNFCNFDYSKCSCYVEEEQNDVYKVLEKYCKKYKLDVGSVVPIYNGECLVLNAVTCNNSESCKAETLKSIIKQINNLGKDGIARYVQPNIHIYQQLSDKVKQYLTKQLVNFTLTFH